MSNLLKAESTKKMNGSPISKKVDTVEFIGKDSMNSEAGVGGSLTYFNGKFNQPNSSNGKTDKPIHKVEAYIADLTSDPENNTATGYLSAKLNSENDNAEVEIQCCIMAEMSTSEVKEDSVYQIVNKHYQNKDSVSVQFDSDVQEAKCVLRGFMVSYSNEHYIKKLTATLEDATLDSSQKFTGDVVAQMIDDSDHKGGGDLYTTLIGSKSADTPWKSKTWYPGDGETTVSFTGNAPLTTAYVFIQGLQLKYKSSEDHKVKKITIDTGTDKLYISKNVENSDVTYSWEVTFHPKLEMKDDSGNSESHSDSYLDLLVVFVPES